MKCFTVILFTLILSLAPAAHAQQQRQLTQDDSGPQRRLALVIGNGAYANAPPLKNPPNDAADMAAALSRLGFDAEHGANLSQRQMKFMIREFGRKLRGGGQGLFYFAGHGVQLRGRNYLIPVDADIQSETDVEDQGVDANLVMGLMDEAGNGLNVVILDACRNNPFARSFRSASNGLAQMDAPGGTLIAYATAPGSVASDGNARNGIYTQELLKFMQTPDLSIEEIFKQVRISVRKLTQGKQTPWEASSLIGEFYFTRVNGDASSPSARKDSPSIDRMAIELVYWDSIKNSTDPEEFKAYLEKYPNGQFAAIAKRRVQPTVNAAPSTMSAGEAATISARKAEVDQAVASLQTQGSSRIDLGKFGETIAAVSVVGKCQVKFEERALYTSKIRFKPTIAEVLITLSDINVASIGANEVKGPETPPFWVVTARTIQGRTFTFTMTGYENRTFQKVKVPTKKDTPTLANVAYFSDSESASRYAKAFASAARLCGAKSETF